MEDFFLLLLVVAFIWLAVRVSSLTTRIKHLEDQQHRIPAPPPQGAPQPALSLSKGPDSGTRVVSPQPPSATPAVAATQAPPPATAPYRAPYIPPPPPPEKPVTPVPPTVATTLHAPKPHVSLEARLGGNWFAKIGITAIVIGVAFGLGNLIKHIGPLGKDAIGFALAIGILGLGIFLERKPAYKLFARVLIGGGWALTFFLSFALYHVPLLQALHSEAIDLTLMFLVAAGMVAHSLRYHSQTVTTFAFLLAFVTVGLSEVTLFSLVAGAILTAALAFIVYRERWYALGLAGLIGVYLNHFLWLQRALPDGGIAYLHQHGHPFPEFLPSVLLLLAYWLIFRLIYVLRPPLAISENPQHDLEQTLATLAALLNSAGLLGLLKYQSSHPEWAFYGLLALGLVELALSLIARGGLKPDADTQPNRVAFITLSTLASVFLLAAIPFRFHGSSWTLFWLLEAEAFYLTGIRIPERIFRRLGILAAFILSLDLLFVASTRIGIWIIYIVGMPSRHHGAPSWHYAVSILSTALVLWFNAEFLTRRYPFITEQSFDRSALRIMSYLGMLLAAAGIWVVLTPATIAFAWVGVAWLILALLLSEVSDRLQSGDLATQSDLLAAATIIRTLCVNIFLNTEQTHGISVRLLTVGLTAILLYLAMRRRTPAHFHPTQAIPATYSWLAGGLIALLCWYQLEPVSVAVAWGIFGLILFELSILFKKSYLRRQSYALLAAAFIRIFFANLNLTGHTSLYTVLPLIAAFAWVYERTHADTTTTRFDKLASQLFAWCSLIAAGTLLYFELRPSWVILAWTLLAIALLALACVLKRTIFIAQSLVVLLAVALRGIFYHLFSPTPLATTFTTSRPFTIGATSALLLAALPLAFYLRRHLSQAPTNDVSSRPERSGAERPASPISHSYLTLLHHPEQPFFFVPLTLITLLLYVQLNGGRITIAWVALGLITFLFALTVKERTYRLSGLGLLLLGVAKVLAWDVWHVSPTDRYLTLIIMGAALLLVSFLYSRYRETLLNFL